MTSGLQSRRSEILDRLAGYAALQQLLQPGTGNTASLGPLQQVARNIASGVDVLNNLMRLLDVDPTVLPLQELFGTQKSGVDLSREIEKRLTDLWDAIDGSAQHLQQEYQRHHSAGARSSLKLA